MAENLEKIVADLIYVGKVADPHIQPGMVVCYTYQQPVVINEKELNKTNSERLAYFRQKQIDLEKELVSSREVYSRHDSISFSLRQHTRLPQKIQSDLNRVIVSITGLLTRYHKKQVEALVTKVNLFEGQWQAYLDGFKSDVPLASLHPLRWSKYEPDVKSGAAYHLEVPKLEGRIKRALSSLGFNKSEPKTRLVLATVLTQSNLESGSLVYLHNPILNEVYVVSSNDLPKVQSRRLIQLAQSYEPAVQQKIENPPVAEANNLSIKSTIKGGIKRENKMSYNPSEIKFFSPEEIAQHLGKVVRGQDYAIKHIAIATYDHLVRPHGVKKSNVLIIGQTGTGKTELARTVAELLSVPFAEAKLSAKSTTGFKGDNLATVFEDLYDHRDNPTLGRSVIFLDEIDKLTTKITSDSGFGTQLQNELIGWIESAIVKVPMGLHKEFSVNTENMLFIGAGAFVELNKPYSDVNREDLIKYGLKPELVGRFPILTNTNPLTKETLVDIIKNGRKSNLNQQLLLLREGYGISLSIDPRVYDILADAAMHQGIGARGIETISNELVKDIKYFGKRGTSLTITPDVAYHALKNFLPPDYKI